MLKLKTRTHIFDVEWAAATPFSGYTSFLAKVVGSDIDTVHSTFRNPNETDLLIVTIEEGENEVEIARYQGYNRYIGFRVDYDGGITVTTSNTGGIVV